ncbi:MAG: hypothetical protein CMG62_07185 [Candidatus Marinimicrobia bacterium]|nr:hypothetical protein [Candidatus Neomarinimicrobiota bacterium]|tara:strand:+ start:1284 stop:1496 length:213 start_codon:yes stop_codon:yes gene_type:complete
MEIVTYFGFILLLIIIGLAVVFFFQVKHNVTDLKNNYNPDIKDSRVLEEMAKKIISDAKMHRKNRFVEED